MTGDPLLGPAEIRRLAADLDLRPRKSLGQNFVIDANTIRRIVKLAELPAGGQVLEVGPGLGSLTLALLADGHDVVAVELDPVLAQRLSRTAAERLPDGRLRVVSADALTLTAGDLTPTGLVANLPYNVAVPVLLHCLATFDTLQRALVMVQREVADRLAAPPGSRVYGVPSVKGAWYGTVTAVGVVPPTVFWPVPRVDSGLVRLVRHDRPLGDEAERRRVFALVDRVFATRRKTLRASLAAWRGAQPAEAALAAAGIDPRTRPEQLDVNAFLALARALPDA